MLRLSGKVMSEKFIQRVCRRIIWLQLLAVADVSSDFPKMVWELTRSARMV
jgi:hypothetical protein